MVVLCDQVDNSVSQVLKSFTLKKFMEMCIQQRRYAFFVGRACPYLQSYDFDL